MAEAAPIKSMERKTVAAPLGKLSSANIGIKSALSPKKSVDSDQLEHLPEANENYDVEDLKRLWKDYAYKQKVEKRDSLFATLTTSEMNISSDHVITLKIKNSVQSNELDQEKSRLVHYLRKNLNNTNISLKYEMEEQEHVSILDSKATFDKLAEENPSLEKFRKLFNLDIEY